MGMLGATATIDAFNIGGVDRDKTGVYGLDTSLTAPAAAN